MFWKVLQVTMLLRPAAALLVSLQDASMSAYDSTPTSLLHYYTDGKLDTKKSTAMRNHERNIDFNQTAEILLSSGDNTFTSNAPPLSQREDEEMEEDYPSSKNQSLIIKRVASN